MHDQDHFQNNSVTQEEELATLDSRAQIPAKEWEWEGGTLVLLQEASFLNPLMSRVGLCSILGPAGHSQCPLPHPEQARSRKQKENQGLKFHLTFVICKMGMTALSRRAGTNVG